MKVGHTPVEIYTDGSCIPNPGPGGWGAILIYMGVEKEIWGGESGTTNNRMELMAAIKALEALTRPSLVHLHTDSEYLQQGISNWIAGWKAKKWKNSKGKPIKNQDLWKRLDALRCKHKVAWMWVKAHAGHPLNERADRLADKGRLEVV